MKYANGYPTLISTEKMEKKKEAQEENRKWIKFSEQQPESLNDSDIEISYDGIEPDHSVSWMENRTCMMAGHAGGYGYFGAGWGSNGSTGCDKGLICDEPVFWRYNISKPLNTQTK